METLFNRGSARIVLFQLGSVKNIVFTLIPRLLNNRQYRFNKIISFFILITFD